MTTRVLLFAGIFAISLTSAKADELEVGPVPREVIPTIISAQGDELELGPVPREVIPTTALKFEKITGGFQVTLNKNNAETLLSAMKLVNNEKELGELIKSYGKDSTDPETVAFVEYLNIAVGSELPAFKKELEKKIGEKGVVVKMYGFNKGKGKERPLLKGLAKALLPEEIQLQAQGIMTMINTRVLFWRIETVM